MAKELSDLRELGSSGLNHMSGEINEEFLKELQGERGRKVLREMADNDPVIGAILFVVDMLMRRVPWKVNANEKGKDQNEQVEFIESCFEDMSSTWSDVISEIMSMLVFGWSYHEIVYKKRLGRDQKSSSKRSKFKDGKIGWRKLPGRAQETLWRWDFDDEGGLKGMVQRPPPVFDTRYIPIEKSLLFRTTNKKNSPEGRSVLRNAVRPHTLKKHIENIEAIGIERDLAGLPIALVPPQILSSDASPKEKEIRAKLEQIVKNVRVDEQAGLIFPLAYDESGKLLYDFKLLSSSGKRAFDTNAIIGRYDQRLSMVVLADFILLGHETHGSFSLSSSKTNLFASALGTWLGHIGEVFNTYAIPRLLELNGFNTEFTPNLKHGDIESPDPKDLGELISNLAGAGMPLFPDPNLENKIRELADLPKAPEDISAMLAHMGGGNSSGDKK